MEKSETSEGSNTFHIQYFSISFHVINQSIESWYVLIMILWWSWPLHDRFTYESISKHLLVRSEQKTPRIIVPHRKSSLAKRVWEVELVSFFCGVWQGEKLLVLVDVRDVITCPKKAKHKQSAQLQPWEFWLKQMKFQNIHRQLFNSGFRPSDSSLRTLAFNVGVVTQIWATKKHWYIPGPSKGRQVVPEGCQFTIPFGFNWFLERCFGQWDLQTHEWTFGGMAGITQWKVSFGFPGCLFCTFIRSTLPPKIWCRFDIISFPSWPYSKTPHEVGPSSFWRLLREMFENSTGQKYSSTTKGVKKTEVICAYYIYIHTHLNKTSTYTHCNYLIRNIMVLVHSWEILWKLLNPYEPCFQHFMFFFEVCYGLDEILWKLLNPYEPCLQHFMFFFWSLLRARWKNLLRKCSKYWRSYKYWSIRKVHPIP